MDEVDSRTVIVDGSNVAHSSEGEKAQLDNIRVIRDKLVDEGFDPVIVADAALRHQIDDEPAFEAMVESGEIKDRREAFPEIRDHIIRYMIINGEVVLERRTRKRRH